MAVAQFTREGRTGIDTVAGSDVTLPPDPLKNEALAVCIAIWATAGTKRMNHRPPISPTSAKDIFHFRSGKVAGKLLTNEVVVEVIAVVMHEDTLFGFLFGFFGGFFGGFDGLGGLDGLGLTLESENGFLVIHQRVIVLDRGEGSDERFFGGFFGLVSFEGFTTDIDMAGTGNQFFRSTTE